MSKVSRLAQEIEGGESENGKIHVGNYFGNLNQNTLGNKKQLCREKR